MQQETYCLIFKGKAKYNIKKEVIHRIFQKSESCRDGKPYIYIYNIHILGSLVYHYMHAITTPFSFLCNQFCYWLVYIIIIQNCVTSNYI